MPNNALLFLGRLLMAALFLPSGIGKAMNFAGFSASLAEKGLPYPEVLAGAAVAAEILGPIALILGVVPGLTSLMLIGFVIVATGISHRYWDFADAAARRGQEISFFKNVGIVGGLMFYWAAGAGTWVLGARKSEPVDADAPKVDAAVAKPA